MAKTLRESGEEFADEIGTEGALQKIVAHYQKKSSVAFSIKDTVDELISDWKEANPGKNVPVTEPVRELYADVLWALAVAKVLRLGNYAGTSTVVSFSNLYTPTRNGKKIFAAPDAVEQLLKLV